MRAGPATSNPEARVGASPDVAAFPPGTPEIAGYDYARAMAARADRLRLIHPDNSSPEVRWPTVEPDKPYAVYIASPQGYRTLALDFDARKGDAGRDAQEAQSLLGGVGIRTVRVTSGGAGSYHVHATFRPPVSARVVRALARALAEKFRSLDPAPLTNPATGCIRPPGAPHRLGGRSEVIGDPHEALAILRESNDSGLIGNLAAELGIQLPRALSPQMEHLLRYGEGERSYETRSHVVQALSLAYVNAGLSEEDLLHDLLDSRNAGGEKVRKARNPARYVHRSWVEAQRKARESPAIQSRSDALAHLAQIRSAAETFPWQGRTGATDWAVLSAHLVVASRAGKLTYDASTRELAELAGVRRQTVTAAHGRLLKAGWLRPNRGRARPTDATTWHLRVPRGACASLPTSSHAPVGAGTCGPLGAGHDVWRWRGLGKTCLRVWTLLDQAGPKGTEEVARLVGTTERTARRNLNRLAAHALVREDKEGLWSHQATDLDEVAQAIGIAGAGAQQQTCYGQEREQHRRALSQWLSRSGRARYEK